MKALIRQTDIIDIRNMREINKLKKQRAEILAQDYNFLSPRKRLIIWSKLENIDFRLKQLNSVGAK